MEQKPELCPHGWLIGVPCGQCDEAQLRNPAPRVQQTTTRFSEAEVKLMGVGAPGVLSLVRERQRHCLDRIYARVKQGELTLPAELAEYACLRDIETDLTNTLRRAEAAEEKRHGNADRAQ